MIWSAIPWKLVGAGALALAVIGASLFLINYGQKLERALVEVERLEVELLKANENTDTCVRASEAAHTAELKWQTTAQNFELAYRRELERAPQPRIVYRQVAATVPLAVPTGNCDLAAVGAWRVLEAAQIVGREP